LQETYPTLIRYPGTGKKCDNFVVLSFQRIALNMLLSLGSSINLAQRDGFQLPDFSGFYRPVFSALFRHERADADLGMLIGELCFLWMVGLAIPLAYYVFDGAGLVVWLVAQLLRQAI